MGSGKASTPRFWAGGWTKTKLMLFSTQVGVGVKVGVELGNKGYENSTILDFIKDEFDNNIRS